MAILFLNLQCTHALLNALPTAAFLLLGLAIAAYVPIVGFLGVGFVGLLGLVVLR